MNSKYFSLLLSVLILLLIEISLMNLRRSELSEGIYFFSKPEFGPPPFEVLTGPQCTNPDLLFEITKGRWIPHDFTEEQKMKVEEDLKHSRVPFKIPGNLQRKDGLCGNVSFLTTSSHRALCDPYGGLPCCYRNQCTPRDVNNCVCDDCYDVSQAIHAELAEWIPTDQATKIYYFQGHKDSCQSLKNMTVYIVGDSYLRHAYVSMLSILNSDQRYGPLLKNAIPRDISLCQNLTLYTPRCKFKIERGVARPCNRTVEIKYFEFWRTTDIKATIKVFKSLKNRPNSWMIIGIGVHENYNSGKVISKFLKPLLDSRRKSTSTWPKIIWSAAHAPGLLKSPKYYKQHKNGTLDYNTKLQEVLDNANITTFNSFQLTDNVVSFDGTHYGKGVNDIKAQILLNYLACQNVYV